MMLCPRHPEQQMEPTGRMTNRTGGRAIYQCPVCVGAIRAKLAVLVAMPLKNGPRCKQIVLPPVIMSERWP